MKTLAGFLCIGSFLILSTSGAFAHTDCPYELYGTTLIGDYGLSKLIALNPLTGESVSVSDIEGNGAHRVLAIDFDDKGTLYAVGKDAQENSALMMINCRIGWATVIGHTGISDSEEITDISFDNDGVLYGLAGEPNSVKYLGTIDIQTGAFTRLDSWWNGFIGFGLVANSHRNFLIGGEQTILVDRNGEENDSTFWLPSIYDNSNVYGLDKRPANGLTYASLEISSSGVYNQSF